jgi:integrase
LRHTAASLALQAGTPLHVVSKMLGHKDPAMTLRVYSWVLKEMTDAAADNMDEYGF